MDKDIDKAFDEQIARQREAAQAAANELGRNVEWCLGVCKPQERSA